MGPLPLGMILLGCTAHTQNCVLEASVCRLYCSAIQPGNGWVFGLKTDLVVAIDQGSGRVPEKMLHMLSTAQRSCSHYSHHDTALPGSGLSRWISSRNLSQLGSRMLDNAGRLFLFGLLRGHACMILHGCCITVLIEKAALFHGTRPSMLSVQICFQRVHSVNQTSFGRRDRRLTRSMICPGHCNCDYAPLLQCLRTHFEPSIHQENVLGLGTLCLYQIFCMDLSQLL